MTIEPRLDIIGAALSDQSRSRILCELMDGRAFTNKELACAAGITPQTTTAHLKHLQGTGLTISIRSGRNIYHRIATDEVAEVLEAMARLSPTDHLTRAHRTLPSTSVMQARSCYNHIAGRLGVLMTDRLIQNEALVMQGDVFLLGPTGKAFFHELGLDLSKTKHSGCALAKPCLDWTERRFHVSGPLGTELMKVALGREWLKRQTGNRSLKITGLGYEVLAGHFDLTRDLIESGTYP